MDIKRGSEQGQPSRRRPDRFTGDAVMDPMLEVPDHSVRIMNVFFEPGARTHWHTHSGGQVLHVTAGRGRVGVRGRRPQPVAAGDVVHFAPDEEHWHGAGPETSMLHLAVTLGDESAYLGPVSDADYAAGEE
jgi:quercetin dioxygenase-like cupin family protein